MYYNCYHKNMQEKKEFNQLEYIKKYNKEHYADLKIRIKKEEKEELDNLLIKHDLSKPAFIRWAIKELAQKKR